METNHTLIYDLDFETLESQINALGQPGFRAKQIWTALYQTFRVSPDEITTLPKDFREKLSQSYSFQALDPVKAIESRDGRTIKTLFKLNDGNYIEAVLMYYDERRTLCISTQSGCGIGCSFCATGQMGFRRNLSSGEIVAQVLYFARMLDEMGDHVTNVVVMGMGEPFQNYDNVMAAINRLNDPRAFGLGARRFTISTVGLVPKIIQFADEGYQYNLAISLHTVDDTLRSKLIPINKKYPVDELISACRYYVHQTSRRITFEYALIQGVNDSVEDALALSKKISGMICHVNLIPLNPTKKFGEQATSADQAKIFCDTLEAHNISCTVRLRRGIEIQAGCGQLATEGESN
ncbi:MAG: 23S rRNA (adenine(2503)-C(2))-methyltransferase RlmN [Brevefilum sp.]|nr:23S rRNA (adenine(2503)-C(2))-methyltransferase RlmN [Brevefilum sp.]MDT8381427.1 23S rRNA (adenine(2503)-C(2))-methyltransferase RlmN [Brevefilum sp.]MDW7754305.1 23S rRNA (adenine(2503)-C(2))-methyltransferase RlmN [Brevefilum sp.]